MAAGVLISTPVWAIENPFQRPKKWNKTVDVLVIGAGGAGLTAAIAAKEAGVKNVLVLEKMAFAGGNTVRAGGGFNAAIKADSEKAGIKDSPELHAAQTLAAGDYRGQPDIVKTLTEEAPKSVQWLKDHGIKFQDRIYQIYGGLYPRARNPLGPRGSAYIQTLSAVCEKEGIPIQTETKVVSIIREKPFAGRVLGVKVETDEGTQYIRARTGVIVCAGGFAPNAKLCGLHDPRLEKLGTTNHPGATGEVLHEMIDLGAQTTDLDYIQCIPGGLPDGKKHPNLFTNVDRFIFVNMDGKRFTNELLTRDVVSQNVLKQKDGVAYLIYDQSIYDSNKLSRGYYADGYSVKGNDIKDLAEKIHVPAANLEATFAQYHEAYKTGKDTAFNRPEMIIPLDKAPYYAALITPGIHHTMGGVTINPKAEVQSKAGKTIQGLYAAGEVTGGVHGGNRIGGNAVADIVTFGRIAGTNAAAYAKAH